MASIVASGMVPRHAYLIPAWLGINFCLPTQAEVGGPNRNCTCDPRVISTVLYSLSYRPNTKWKPECQGSRKQKTDRRVLRLLRFTLLVPFVSEAGKREGC